MLLPAYLIAVSTIASGLTLYDKYAANKRLPRINERTLMLVSIIGGAVAMYITMRLARHKTKHLKFMLGLPVIIALQIAAVLAVWWLDPGSGVGVSNI